VDVQRSGACDDHEEPDHPGEDRSDHHVDVLVAEVLHLEVLVGGIGLDEDEAPGCERGPDRGNGAENGIARERQQDVFDPGGRSRVPRVGRRRSRQVARWRSG
jgi:hypothetical protein